MEAVAGSDFQRLQLVRSMCETPENVLRNVERTLSVPYERFNEHLGSQKGRTVSICGSGPSFATEYRHTVGDILACNGAHDYLLERGIIPKYALFMDAAEFMDGFIKLPHPDVTYLVASRCHESVFKRLEGCKVVVWHCMGDPGLIDFLEQRSVNEPAVHGGSAAVTRAMIIAYALGYEDWHVFGCDSSYDGDTHHVGDTLVEEKMIDTCPVIGGVGGKWFKSTAWMAGQVEDFIDMVPQMHTRGVKITVHGTGLLPEMAKAMGLTVLTQGDNANGDNVGK